MKVPFLPLDRLLEPHRAEFHAALDRVLDSGRVLLGTELERFEVAFAAHAGTAHAVGTSSGLDALALMFLASELPAGSEVLVPANSFIASALGIERAHLRAVPVDIDPRTGNIDPSRLEDALTSRTRAVLAVHLHGIPCDMDALGTTCTRLGLELFEDAAQAHGALWRDRPCGSFGRAAAFSFYPGKNLGALGDAGAVATNDPELDDRLRLWRNYGSRRKYEHELPGWNARLDEIQAAFLSIRLARLSSDNTARRRCAEIYRSRLADDQEIQLPEIPPGAQPAWHLFPILTRGRDALQEHLAAAGIGTLVHYPVPLHRQPCLPGNEHRALPGAEAWCARTLSLPIHPMLSAEEIDQVCEAITGR